jgi:CDP-L-myo-inositol myo-inositolphosphotransferase
MGSEKSPAGGRPHEAVLAFASGRDADRRIAGVSAAGRAVHALAAAGGKEAVLAIAGEAPLNRSTLEDIERLRGSMAVRVTGRCEGAPEAVVPSAAAILRASGKPGDGPVSRWLNRPISQRLSRLVLAIPAARPVHATLVTAFIAVIMFASLLTGGEAGLIAGGLLFHSASVIDGVDGEMARATFRATDGGAALDSAVDIATNFLFVLGVTLHMGWRDGLPSALVGAWGLGIFAVGTVIVAWKSRRDRAAPGSEPVKRVYARRFDTPIAGTIIRAATIVTSRDFFAFLFMALILAGLEEGVLYIFAAAASVWIFFVLGTVGSQSAKPVGHTQPGFRGAA